MPRSTAIMRVHFPQALLIGVRDWIYAGGNMDFSSLLREEEMGAVIEPRELHGQLPNKAVGYGYLRDVQAQVLTAWHRRRDDRDLVIKVNTGGGKTINGLLILQSYLNEGIRPALYVAPDKYLVQQVLKEAARLGLETVENPDDSRYLAGEAIAVVNAYKLFNGRTVFSEKRASKPALPIGAVVIDDAHAALATTRQQLSLTIERKHDAYHELLTLFKDDLRTQSAEAVLDLEEDSNAALVRIPFWAWNKKTQQVREILRRIAQTNGDPLYFQWPAVSEALHLCRAVFTNRSLTVSPPCPQIKHVTSFAQAQRRIYLTATLADDSVLVTDFGADPESIATSITPLTAGDIGERMILAPQEINPSISDQQIREEATKLSKQYNTVVLVPSDAAARSLWPDADVTAQGDEVEEVVERLKAGNHIGLVVLANKYDGIDLPQNACRVLVIDGLPASFSGEERLESLLTSYENGVDDRQVQRIEQGMGRGVRSNEDHCLIFLIGSRLAQLTVDPRTASRFSPATQAQLRLSRQVARQMDNQPLSRIIETAKQALERDPDWVKLAKQALRGVGPQTGQVSRTAAVRREAFDAALRDDINTAVIQLEKLTEATENHKQKGWLQEQAATYLDQIDPSRAQSILALAHSRNPHVLRPLSGVTFRKLASTGAQAERASEAYAGRFGSPASLRLGFESVLSDLKFDPDRTEDFEDALFQLGVLLGLGSQRPEHEMGEGPDNLLLLGFNTYWVIEAKSGATSQAIGKRDAAQLGQAILWFGKRYDPQATAIPVMVHPSQTLYKDATAIPGMKVLTPRGLGNLVSSVRTFSEALAATTLTNAADIERLLTGHNLAVEDLDQYLVDVRSGVRGLP